MSILLIHAPTQVYWLIFALAWGMARLIETRIYGPDDENSWAFGQILPLVLLAALIVTIIEHFSDIDSVQTSPSSPLMPLVCAYPSPIPMASDN